MLVLERLDGQPAARRLGHGSAAERERVAYAVATLWMEMVFRKGIFHADPHPANILVLPDGRIGLVDFGVAGRITRDDMRRLIRLFIDAVSGNSAAFPRRLQELGVRFPREREEDLRADLEVLWQRYAGASLADLDPNELLRDLLGVIHRQRLQLPTRFLLLDRALITLGSVGQELYPSFNVFELARPYAQELTLEQYSPAALLARAREEVGASTQAMLELPRDVAALVEALTRGDVEISVRQSGLDEPLRRLDATANRLVLALVLSGVLVGSALLAGVQGGPHVLGIHVAAFLGYLAASFIGFVLVVAMARRGRL